ncbi:MAG TPA: TIM barrel protein [archaeon]|nr:TIM barrel protein [archaeon]
MNILRFGTAGIPLSTSPRDTANGIKQVRKLGLENMELEFVHSVNITPEKAPEIKRVAKENDVVLTCHGQYYINLNSQEKEKIEASKQRILKAAKITSLCGGWSVCFHAAHYMGDIIGAYHNVKNSLKEVMKKLKNDGIKIWIRPETGGRLTQFGSLEELIKVCQEVEGVLPCIDFSHHYSRSLGEVNTTEKFREILEGLEKGLGRVVLDNMHIHTQGIEFGDNGEKNHQTLAGSDFNYKDLLKVWKEFNIKGVVVCESPIIEQDALLLKKVYNSISP